MLILVYGEDTFRVAEKVKQLKKAFADKFDPSGLNTHTFPSEDSSTLNAPEILQSVCSYPFLGSKRMALICDLLNTVKKADQAVWVDGFSRMPDSTIVVLWETDTGSSIEKKPLLIEIEKMTEVYKYPFPELQGVALSKWVSDRILTYGGTIDALALRALVERVGSNLWQLSSEIHKLIGYAGGSMITKEMVEMLVHTTFEGKIFELMDVISKKQTSRAVRLLEEERSSGSDDHYLLTMLGRQVRILLGTRAMLDQNSYVTKQEVGSALEIHPFVAQKALEQARKFVLGDLARAHDLLFEFDQKIKTGRIGADLSVDLVVDELTKSSVH
jgi:DNA polymerase-3 subunit delta